MDVLFSEADVGLSQHYEDLCKQVLRRSTIVVNKFISHDHIGTPKGGCGVTNTNTAGAG